jgi:superfamily II DNA or RNA helicase
MQSSIKAFEALRSFSPQTLATSEKFSNQPGAIFIQLTLTDDETDTPWVRVVNVKGEPVNCDYRTQSGGRRGAIKAMQQVEESLDDRFNWGDSTGLDAGFNLREAPELLPVLARCDALVDSAMQPIKAVEETKELSLILKRYKDQPLWKAEYALTEDGKKTPSPLQDDPVFLSDRYLFSGSHLFQHQSSGGSPAQNHLFADTVPDSDLETFLSLFASSYPNVPIRLGENWSERGEPVLARPGIGFREVDEEGTLYLELLDIVEPLSETFIREFDIAALVVRREGQLIRHEIDYSVSFEARRRLTAELEKLERKAKKDPQAWLAVDDSGTLLLSRELAQTFLQKELGRLANEFKIMGGKHLLRYKVRYSRPKLKLNLRGGSGIDFLEGDGSLELEGERISILSALSEYRKNGYIQMSDGNRALLDENYMARLERLFKKKGKQLRVSFFDLPLIEEKLEARMEASELPKVREIFEGFNEIPKRHVPLPRFKGKLRPYQKSGLQWIDYLYAHKLGGCLADDMGLGKTIQAIALLSRIYPKVKRPTLIVMPRSLLFNWESELERFAPQLKVSTHHGTSRDWEKAAEAQIILTTYGTIRSEIETIVKTRFHAVLLDESQAIKNTQAQTTRAVLSLEADFRLALSGTPVENNLSELYSLFSFLNPSMFRTRAEFERDYVGPVEKNGDPEAAEELRRKIRPFLLRRIKQEVLDDLPEKVEQTLYVDMAPEHLKHYETRRRFYKEIIRKEVEAQGLARSRLTILEAMLELRQIATIPEVKTEGAVRSSKIERLIEATTEAAANGHKCLIFSNFLGGVELVCDALKQEEIPHLSMTGASNNRQALVEQFQEDPALRAFVMTLKTGGVGLNLTAADHVFILDPWWNQSAESQAIDRAHRMGQRNAVFTYRLITRGTIEEKILLLQQKKRALVDQIITTDSESFKQLDESDIEALFAD